ncbi:response regulator [Rugosimonospora africana]|uniref:response regulator n=1 Tax=Rugosimonospora africana TaxID=556532 RepID=UPI00194227E4|nr:response regulator transcription factor [Rugosimonospora africana]
MRQEAPSDLGGVWTHAHQQAAASNISVLLGDDHAIFAEALKVRLGREADLHPISIAYDAEQVRARVTRDRPRVVVLDIALAGVSGVALAGHVREISPETRVVILSGVEPATAIVAAVRCGVRAWLSKTVRPDDLVRAIRGVARGEAWFAPDVLGQVLTALVHRAPETPGALAALTPRETEVLQCLVNGMTRDQIARGLHLTTNTVRTHIQNLLAKSGVHTTLELTALAFRHGFRSTQR